MKNRFIQLFFAAALCAVVFGTPVTSLARINSVVIPAEELELYVREQSIREEIEQAYKEKEQLERKLYGELKTFEFSIETMRSEALSDYRKKLRRPGLSDADKAAIRSAYEKQCAEIEAKLAEKKRQTETAIATIKERLGSSWRGTGLYGEQEKIGERLQETVAKEAPGALSRLLNNGMVDIPGKDYRMGRYEVDQALWQAVMGENPSEFKGANRPVENVSWNDVQEFLRKLNAMPNVIEHDIEFRLPTEQEWEYACRADATGDEAEEMRYRGGDYCKLADGTAILEWTLDQVAWFENNSGNMTHPVGQKKPNAFGLYDMHGNVWEWTATAFGEICVNRGGSWFDSAEDCESSRRGRTPPSNRDGSLGFRLCASGRADTAPNSQKEASHLASSPAVKSMAESILASLVDIPGKDYKIGKTEVTQAQWEAIMGKNPSRFKGENNPVEQVSWDDCQEFLSLLNLIPVVKDSGLTFRLPTEEEWEYACRAGASGNYCKLANGTEITENTLGQVAWFDNNSDGKTHPVGQKKPNAWGLYDMHGNVWEWTSTADGEARVNRGGSWFDSAWLWGFFFRYEDSPSDRSSRLGFRLCADEGK